MEKDNALLDKIKESREMLKELQERAKSAKERLKELEEKKR